MNMDLTHLFPTTIGSFIDVETSKKFLPIARKILDNPANLTNTWQYNTTYGSRNYTDGESHDYNSIHTIEEYFVNIGGQYLKSLGYKTINLKAKIFFSEMFDGDFHVPHEHPSSVLSGVFYLHVPQGSSSIRFYDPRVHTRYIDLPIVEHAYTNWNFFNVAPEEGLLLIFPSWLTHEILKNESASGRITAVFNLVETEV